MGENHMELQLFTGEFDSQKELFHQYFDRMKPQLIHSLESAYKTPYGKETLLPLGLTEENLTYAHFANTVPLIKSSDISIDPMRYVLGNIEKMRRTFSAGTSGKPKEFYWPPNEIKGNLPEVIMKAFQESDKPVLIHGNWPSVDHDIARASLQAIRANIPAERFNKAGDVLESLLRADTIYFVTEPANLRSVLFGLTKLTQNDEYLAHQLKGKKLFLELGSEPVALPEIQQWFVTLKEMLGENPDIVLTYGQNDSGFLGLYKFEPGHSEVDFKYKVPGSKFVEVVDSSGKPVIGKKGALIASTLRSEGSILTRYVTGDQATLTLDRNENVFLSDVGRTPDEGMLSFWGKKMYLPGIYEFLREHIPYPLKLEAQLSEDVNGLFKRLNLNVYSERFLDQHAAEKAKQDVLDALSRSKEYSWLSDLAKGERLELNIRASGITPRELLKGWRILPKQQTEVPS